MFILIGFMLTDLPASVNWVTFSFDLNIFFTDWDPLVAARDSCDKYVVKIPV